MQLRCHYLCHHSVRCTICLQNQDVTECVITVSDVPFVCRTKMSLNVSSQCQVYHLSAEPRCHWMCHHSVRCTSCLQNQDVTEYGVTLSDVPAVCRTQMWLNVALHCQKYELSAYQRCRQVCQYTFECQTYQLVICTVKLSLCRNNIRCIICPHN